MTEVAVQVQSARIGARRFLAPIEALRFLAGSRETILIGAIIALSLVMGIAYPDNFLTPYNFSAVVLNAAQNGILVTGMMLLMIAGMFDLSIGSTLAFAGVVSAAMVAWWHLGAELALLGGIAAGALLGAINGFIVTRIRINAPIATLATMAIYRGITQLVSGTGITPIGTALVAVDAAGICTGDLYIYLGKNSYVSYPRIGGHEIAGRVVALGPDTQGPPASARVVVEPFIGCGRCYSCRIGKPNCCANLQIIGVHREGGFAESVVAPVDRLHLVSDSLTPFQASFAEPVAIGVPARRGNGRRHGADSRRRPDRSCRHGTDLRTGGGRRAHRDRRPGEAGGADRLARS
jgi:hypothetical protein